MPLAKDTSTGAVIVVWIGMYIADVNNHINVPKVTISRLMFRLRYAADRNRSGRPCVTLRHLDKHERKLKKYQLLKSFTVCFVD